MANTTTELKDQKKKNSIFDLLKPYSKLLFALILLALLSNGINLFIPQIIAQGINEFTLHTLVFKNLLIEFFAAAFGILVFTYLQSIVQTYASERVGRDMRNQFADKISVESYRFVQKANPNKLLTNLTSDIDAVKVFVAQAVTSIISSVFVIIGASILLLVINWRLALAVLIIVPIIGAAFYFILGRMRPLFMKTRENIDWLNKIINESILGSAIIRVLNAQQPEYEKFLEANTDTMSLGFSILKIMAAFVPIISFTSNMAILIILALGGRFVINGSMSLGDLAAFNSYIFILIFPVMIIGFMSNVIARATASYERIRQIMDAPSDKESGTSTKELLGNIKLKKVNVLYDGRPALKDISFEIFPKTKTAIIGPTAAGKSQILNLLTGLMKPDSGTVEYDDMDISEYDSETLHRQIGMVFQDSVMFNMSLRENIAFSDSVSDESLHKAIETAELGDFISTLPNGLDTIASERGTSLSGGQKQRIMLARALALDPKILLLDDFTARVDAQTERKILKNVQDNYPDLTLISVTQKIAAVEHYDKIILLMEGEMLASGTHEQLMQNSPEYVQIYNSQRSTSQYELQA
jgi:ATP-binding cassette subfamily B protein